MAKDEKKVLTPIEQYASIMEWLYTNDGAHDSKQDWREAVNDLLREVILGEESNNNHTITVCTCS